MGFFDWLRKHFPPCDEEMLDYDPVERYQAENPRACTHIYPSVRELVDEVVHNAITLDGTIIAGLPRTKQEVTRLREEVSLLRKDLKNLLAQKD
jgi:hypothetical protein